jgi:hypothetical protein
LSDMPECSRYEARRSKKPGDVSRFHTASAAGGRDMRPD